MGVSDTVSYDVVVIGGGHTGLALGALLGGAGRRVAVLEQEPEFGGMARTDGALGPGVVHHPHAVLLGFAEVMPLRRELRAAGLRWAVPTGQHALAFEDGRPALVLHRRDMLRSTHDSIAAVSRRDAALLVDLLERSHALSATVGRLLVTAPDLEAVAGHLTAISDTYRGLRLAVSARTSAIEFIATAFASPQVQTLLLALAHELGGDPSAAGSAIGFLGVVMWQIGRRAVPVGGMGSVVSAFRTVAERAGAELCTDAGVVDLIRSDDRVVGVVCADGRTIRAGAVVSTLDETATHELAGTAAEPPPALGGTAVVRQHLLLDAPLLLGSERSLRDRAVQTFFGWDEPAAILDRLAGIAQGAFPAAGGALLRPSVGDAAQSPPRGDVVLVDSTFPAVGTMTAAELQAVARHLPAATWSRIGDYGRGSGSHLLDSHVAPIGQGDRQIRLRTGAEHYRTAIPGLWRAGAGVHPGGGVHGGSAAIVASLLLSEL